MEVTEPIIIQAYTKHSSVRSDKGPPENQENAVLPSIFAPSTQGYTNPSETSLPSA